jgi:hypothetical protein
LRLPGLDESVNPSRSQQQSDDEDGESVPGDEMGEFLEHVRHLQWMNRERICLF